MKKINLKFDTGSDKKILIDRNFLEDKCNSVPYIYIRIPRTGSTSISKVLANQGSWPHFYASLVRDLIGEQSYNEKFVFASVRNPWDRLVSWYHFNCHDTRAGDTQKQKYKSLGFKGWIMESCPHVGWKPHHFAHQPEDPICQLTWITDDNGKIIVDHIVRLENLQSDLEQIKDKLGLSSLRVPVLNQSHQRKEKNYRTYYDQETKNKVFKLFEEDIRTFKYEF